MGGFLDQDPLTEYPRGSDDKYLYSDSGVHVILRFRLKHAVHCSTLRNEIDMLHVNVTHCQLAGIHIIHKYPYFCLGFHLKLRTIGSPILTHPSNPIHGHLQLTPIRQTTLVDIRSINHPQTGVNHPVFKGVPSDHPIRKHEFQVITERANLAVCTELYVAIQEQILLIASAYRGCPQQL